MRPKWRGGASLPEADRTAQHSGRYRLVHTGQGTGKTTPAIRARPKVGDALHVRRQRHGDRAAAQRL
jgi:hypothetical protein